jgi:hypothetical protein
MYRAILPIFFQPILLSLLRMRSHFSVDCE